MAKTPPGWEGILQPDETILWRGKPEPGIRWRDAIGVKSLFGVFFGGFALFWMAGASALLSGGPGFPFTLFPLFGLPFLLVGIYMAAGHVFIDAYVRANTWYTLSDRTAFVATDAFGRKNLKSYPIRDMPFLDLEDDRPGSIFFGEVRRQNHTQRVGFLRIIEARQVYRMLREARGALNFADRQG